MQQPQANMEIHETVEHDLEHSKMERIRREKKKTRYRARAKLLDREIHKKYREQFAVFSEEQTIAEVAMPDEEFHTTYEEVIYKEAEFTPENINLEKETSKVMEELVNDVSERVDSEMKLEKEPTEDFKSDTYRIGYTEIETNEEVGELNVSITKEAENDDKLEVVETVTYEQEYENKEEENLLNEYIDYELSENELNDDQEDEPEIKVTTIEQEVVKNSAEKPQLLNDWFVESRKNEQIENTVKKTEVKKKVPVIFETAKKVPPNKRRVFSSRDSAKTKKLERFEPKPTVDAEIHWIMRENSRLKSRSYVEPNYYAAQRHYDIFGRESGYGSFAQIRGNIQEVDDSLVQIDYYNVNNLIPEAQEYPEYPVTYSSLTNLNGNMMSTNYDELSVYDSLLDTSLTKNEAVLNESFNGKNTNVFLRKDRRTSGVRNSTSSLRQSGVEITSEQQRILANNTLAHHQFHQKHLIRLNQHNQQIYKHGVYQQRLPPQQQHQPLLSTSNTSMNQMRYQNSRDFSPAYSFHSPTPAYAPAASVLIKSKLEPLMPSTNIVHHREFTSSTNFIQKPVSVQQERRNRMKIETIVKPETRIPLYQYEKVNNPQRNLFVANQQQQQQQQFHQTGQVFSHVKRENNIVNSKTRLEPLEPKVAYQNTSTTVYTRSKIPSYVSNKVVARITKP